MEETRDRSYRADSAMITILTFTIVLLIVITSLGIVGQPGKFHKLQNIHTDPQKV